MSHEVRVRDCSENPRRDCSGKPGRLINFDGKPGFDKRKRQENQTKQAKTIPKIIIETLAMLNLWPSLVSKIIVEEMWNKIPITTAVICV